MVLVLTVFIVVMTVVINGVTMAPLMKLLKMTDVPSDRRYMLKRATNQLKVKNTTLLSHLRDELGEYLPDVDWKRVSESEELWGEELSSAADGPEISGPAGVKSAWMLVLNLQRAYYKRNFESGTLGSHAFTVLEDFTADLAAEAADTSAKDLSSLYDRKFKSVLVAKIQKQMTPMDAYEAGLTYLLAQKEVLPASSN